MKNYILVAPLLVLFASNFAIAADNEGNNQEFRVVEFSKGLVAGAVVPGTVGTLGYMGAGLLASFGYTEPIKMAFPNLFKFSYAASTAGALYKLTEPNSNKSLLAGWTAGSVIPLLCLMRLHSFFNS